MKLLPLDSFSHLINHQRTKKSVHKIDQKRLESGLEKKKDLGILLHNIKKLVFNFH